MDEGLQPAAEALPDLVPLESSYLHMACGERREHNVKDFLSRPLLIKSFLWPTSTIAGDALPSLATGDSGAYKFPEVFLSQAAWKDKLRGFVGLRATLVIRVQVNSMPFQQGRLMLQYVPYAKYLTSQIPLVNASLTGRSGCPHVDLDLSVSTECELRIPYVSPHLYYNLITGQGSFGYAWLVVYSPLKVAATEKTNVEVSVWAHLEDVDVQFPTGADIKAQMGKEDEDLAKNHAVSKGIGVVASGLHSLAKVPVLGPWLSIPAWICEATGYVFKLFGWSKPTIKGTIIETKLRTTPRMCTYDGADTSHKLALCSENEIATRPGMAGTSKDEMAIQYVVQTPNFWRRFTWAATATTNTTLFQDFVTPAKINNISATVTDRYYATHMGYVSSCFNAWRGSIVYNFKFVKTKFHSGRVTIYYVPYYYETDLTKTTVDRSRCQRIVVDLRTSNEVSFTVPYVSSRPWMFCAPMVDPLVKGSDDAPNRDYQYATGSVYVEVLNALVSPSSVADDIDVIVEVYGGTDLEFASPRDPLYLPYGNATNLATATLKAFSSGNRVSRDLSKSVQPSVEDEDEEDDFMVNDQPQPPLSRQPTGLIKMFNKRYPKSRRSSESETGFYWRDKPDDEWKWINKPETIVTQMMSENEAAQRNNAQTGETAKPIMDSLTVSNWGPAAYCMGEKVVSVRQLVKRFGTFARALITGFNSINNIPVGRITINPWQFKAPLSSTGAPSATEIDGIFDVPSDYVNYFANLYAFWRGSKRLKIDLRKTNFNTTTNTSPNTYIDFAVTQYEENVIVQLNNGFYAKQQLQNQEALSFYRYTGPIRMYKTRKLDVAPGVSDGLVQYDPISVDANPAMVIVNPKLEGMIEIEVPYYNVSHLSPVFIGSTADVNDTVLYQAQQPCSFVSLLLPPRIYKPQAEPYSTVSLDVQVFSAAGDDFSFMYLLGCPPMIRFTQPEAPSASEQPPVSERSA